MTDDILHDRGRAIEAQWARQRDEELIQKLRERAKLEEISRCSREEAAGGRPGAAGSGSSTSA